MSTIRMICFFEADRETKKLEQKVLVKSFNLKRKLKQECSFLPHAVCSAFTRTSKDLLELGLIAHIFDKTINGMLVPAN